MPVRDKIAMDVNAGLADIASVAAFALANPSLVARLQSGAPLNEPDRATFYGGDERGYTDYPTLDSGASGPVISRRIRTEEAPQLVDEKIRDLQCRKVTAAL